MHKPKPLVGFAHEQKVISNSAASLTAGTYAPAAGERAEEAFITCSGGECRWTYDGTTPTASLGHILHDGGFVRLKGTHQIDKFQAIRYGSTDATLDVTYERL